MNIGCKVIFAPEEVKMIKINENFLKLQDSYLFSSVNQKVSEYKKVNLNANLIKMGIGDVTRPIPKVVVDAMIEACKEMEYVDTFKGDSRK